jgi:hypothetical protein
LKNSETIVERTLPLPKLKAYFKDVDAAKMFLLNKVTFCEERVKVNSIAPSARV